MERTNFATTVDKDLLKKFKMLAIENDKKINEFVEEAMKLLLERYKNK